MRLFGNLRLLRIGSLFDNCSPHEWFRLQPVKVSLGPAVDKPNHQDAEKNHDLEENEQSEAVIHQGLEYQCPGIEERHLYIEDQEYQGQAIEANVEAYPGRADRGLTTLVGLQLARLIFAANTGTQKPAQDGNREDDKEDAEEGENKNVE